MGGPGSGRRPKHPPAAAKSTTRTSTPSISARSDSDDSGDEGEPFHWGTCVVATNGPLAASHALVTHAKSNRSYGVRLLLRKPGARYASVPASSLSSHSRDVDICKDSVRTYRALLAIQLGPAHTVPPITFAPSLPVTFAGSTYAPSAWHEAWARWDSAWLRALVAPMHATTTTTHEPNATPDAYVVMWDARHLTEDFPPHDVCIEHTDASNDRIRRHHARASAAFAPLSRDPTTALSVDPAAAPLCIICSAPAGAYSEGPWYSARTVTDEDTSSAVSTDRSSTTLSVDSPRSTTTTTTDTLTETTTTTTISTTTTTTTKTTRTARSAYPRGLRPDLHALYDACARACPTGLAVCSTPTCRLALCIPCFVAHFPFDAHCDLLPISRAAHSHWQCPRCDHTPTLGAPLSPPESA